MTTPTTTPAQPEALRLADALASNYFDGKHGRDVWDAAAAELRRLHAQVAALTAALGVQSEPLHITHGPLMRYAAFLLRSRKPALPEHESVADELEMAADGHPTPAGEPAAEWLEVARIAEAAPAQPAEGAAYAELPTGSAWCGAADVRDFGTGPGESALMFTPTRTQNIPLFTAAQMRAFADATHALRASHGQAPAGAEDETWCAYVAGMICTYLKEDAEGAKAKAIAGIIARRLMFLSPPTAQPAPAATPQADSQPAPDALCRIFLVTEHHARDGKIVPVYGSSLRKVLSGHTTREAAERARTEAEDAYNALYPGYQQCGNPLPKAWVIQEVDVIPPIAARTTANSVTAPAAGAVAESATLHRLLRDMRDWYRDHPPAIHYQPLLDQVEAALAAAPTPAAQQGEDTARLEWLAKSSWYVGPGGFYCDEAGGMVDYDDKNMGPAELRAAIDAERAALAQKGGK